AGIYGESGATGGCGGSGGSGGGAGNTTIGLVVRGDQFPRVEGTTIAAQNAGSGGNGARGQTGGAGGGLPAETGELRATHRRFFADDEAALPVIVGNATEPPNGGPSFAYLNGMVANAGRGGTGGPGGGGGGGAGGNGGWAIAVMSYGADVPLGVESGLDLSVPTAVSTGGDGGAGGTAGSGSEVGASIDGPDGLDGESCQIWNASTNVGVTCVGE
ncbi:MAG: hypothetical protein ACI82G_000514, partial [Bradymonadia bacterium]